MISVTVNVNSRGAMSQRLLSFRSAVCRILKTLIAASDSTLPLKLLWDMWHCSCHSQTG